jgi:hypothetical protein
MLMGVALAVAIIVIRTPESRVQAPESMDRYVEREGEKRWLIENQ